LKSTCTGSLEDCIDALENPFNLILKKNAKGGKNLPPLKIEHELGIVKTGA
jgi:hypothetical protein